MEATGRHSLGVALALHDAGHIVSIVNPAQIRDFARTKLGRNKTDKLDAVLIREYAGLFKPGPWAPPSPAMRRLCELQTVRTGIVNNRAEWKNRIGSGLGDSIAISLAAATIEHFTAQIEAVDKAIRETIDQDDELRGKCHLLLSVVGVGETLAASLLAEMPAPEVLRRSGEMVAYAGLNPCHHRSGTSIVRPTSPCQLELRGFPNSVVRLETDHSADRSITAQIGDPVQQGIWNHSAVLAEPTNHL